MKRNKSESVIEICLKEYNKLNNLFVKIEKTRALQMVFYN